MRPSFLPACAFLVVTSCSLGCTEGFAPADEVNGLRVLAVHKDRPYAAPGERVQLQVLWHEPSPERQQRPPQIAWIALCENPPSDLFELCFSQIGQRLGDAVLGGADPNDPSTWPADVRERISFPSEAGTVNDSFSFRVSEDIISSRPQASQGDALPYGLTFVFFAVCAGELQLEPDGDFPLACFRDGERLGAEGFVVGYSSVFSYLDISNANPELIPYVEFGEHTFVPSAAPERAQSIRVSSEDLCFGEDCQSAGPSQETDVCPDELQIQVCDDDCPERHFRMGIDPSSAELDPTTPAFEGEALREQMWVNYYTTGGSFPGGAVRLLNDASAGWNEDHGTEYSAHDAPGVHHLWAVAHDNRGGASWARLRVCATNAE